MTSDSSGKGQVFWLEKGAGRFAAERSQFFDVQHDGKKHEYAIEVNSMSSLQAVRIDPSKGEGKIEISSLRLTNKDSKTVYQWSF